MQQKVTAEPFLFDAVSAEEPTEFQIFFRTDEYEYRYYLGVLKDEISAETLDRKKLAERSRLIFFIMKAKKSVSAQFCRRKM